MQAAVLLLDELEELDELLLAEELEELLEELLEDELLEELLDEALDPLLLEPSPQAAMNAAAPPEASQPRIWRRWRIWRILSRSRCSPGCSWLSASGECCAGESGDIGLLMEGSTPGGGGKKGLPLWV
jgi:hypothetical protein